MICQHCQTWVLDDDHRCRRCGRRLRSTPSRISPASYPVTGTATAPAYDFHPQHQPDAVAQTAQQQALFTAPVNESRVIPFDSLTTEAARRSMQARAAAVPQSSGAAVYRPAPLTAEKVEVRRAKSKKVHSANQRHLELFGQEEVLSQPDSSIICDAPVAPAMLRVQAGLIDLLLMGTGCAVVAIVFGFCTGGRFSLDKYTMLFLATALVALPLLYRLLWAFAGLDSIGMQKAGLRLVDFDGNPPSKEHRYYRIFGSILSLLAAGMGLIWTVVDQDRLSWHDHISGTFPTIASED